MRFRMFMYEHESYNTMRFLTVCHIWAFNFIHGPFQLELLTCGDLRKSNFFVLMSFAFRKHALLQCFKQVFTTHLIVSFQGCTYTL